MRQRLKVRRLRSICWEEKPIKDQKKLSDSDSLENVTVGMSWLSLYLFKLFSDLESQVFCHYLFKLYLNLKSQAWDLAFRPSE